MGIRQTFGDVEVRSDAEAATARVPRQSNHRSPTSNSTKKNHFVPCFYSSLWTGGDGKLCEFTRPYDRVKPLRKHPAATGYSPNLYTEAALPPALRTYLEDGFLKRVDQRAFDTLQLILANRIADLTPDLRSAWARFIMSMIQRSPGKIAKLRKLWRGDDLKYDHSVERRYRELRKETDPPTFREYLAQAPLETSGRGQVQLFQNVMDLPRVGTQIVNMIWGVLTIPDVPFKLLTSDRPIIMTNGIGRAEAHVAVPIGPRKLFLAANKQETIDWIIALSPSDVIMQVNTMVVMQAEKFVYGESDFAINFVEKHLRR